MFRSCGIDGSTVVSHRWFPVVLSMAEMALSLSQRMDDIFQPRWQKVLYYLTGWVSIKARQISDAAGIFITVKLM